MIYITSQSATTQYDVGGNAITHWDNKRCAWIINKPYENEEIDWWGKDNDFPAGCTKAQYEVNNPGWSNKPNITITWSWEKEAYIKAFGGPWKMFDPRWDSVKHLLTGADLRHCYTAVPDSRYPYRDSRSWGHLDYTQEEAIDMAKRYCDLYENATDVSVFYNNKLIHTKEKAAPREE